MFKRRSHSFPREKIKLTLIQYACIIKNVFIDCNCFSGEHCGPWASCVDFLAKSILCFCWITAKVPNFTDQKHYLERYSYVFGWQQHKVFIFFSPGMFTYDKKAGVHWFSSAQCESYQEFNLVGVVSFYVKTIISSTYVNKKTEDINIYKAEKMKLTRWVYISSHSYHFFSNYRI